MEDGFEETKGRPPAETETSILAGKWGGNWELRIEHGGDSAETPLIPVFVKGRKI